MTATIKPAIPAALVKRAQLYADIRAFFKAKQVLEVETPLLSQAATVDKHIESFCSEGRYLQTSPEFAMKRLLAQGSGAIYQLCKVFRLEEAGRWHNPEFTMLEWYRPHFDHHDLMQELAELLAALGVPTPHKTSYRQAFIDHAGFDPFSAPLALLQAHPHHPEPISQDRDTLLDVWMSFTIAPALQNPTFIYDFPASQAALSRVENGVAQRFELIWQGVELANGFHELTDPQEQQQRFEADQAYRRQHGLKVPPFDARLIEALPHLPPCAGVAVGVDRLLALLLGQGELVLAFGWDQA